ncbi:MAG: hypothetical protein K2H86_00075, partial [Muribaculaceae bacterium]|nr:hypothetical protein [Muribaculaceae bacterium]
MSGSVKKIIKITTVTIASIILLIVIAISGATLYLTPQRLTEIVNREASQWLKADIEASNIRYTIWSSFPRLAIETDSITVISRTLKDLPDSVTDSLPENSDFLASVKSFAGQINIIDFISGRYVIHDAKVEGLRVNLVAYNDSINNYNIVPDDVTGFKKVPYFTAQSVVIRNAGKMQYYSAATQTKADLTLQQLDLNRLDRAPIIGKKTNRYKLTVAGKVTAAADGLTLLDKFPFYLNGDMTLRFDPFGVDLTDYDINLGNVKGKLNMAVGIGDNPSVDKFEYKISSINLMTLLGYLPQKYIPDLTGVQAELPINASARLTSPWLFSSEQLPSMQIQLDVPQGDIKYTMAADGNPAWQGKTFTLRHSPINGIFNFNGAHPECSTVAIQPFTISSDGIVCRTDATVTGLTDSPLVTINFNCDADIRKALSYLDIADDIKTSGALNADAKLSFRLSDFSDAALSEGLRNVNAIADISLADANISIPDENRSATASVIRINLTAAGPVLRQN